MFSLEIKVEAFLTKDSVGKKSYCKGKVVKFAWEVGSISYDLLHSSLSSVVSWSSNQKATLWFFDKTLGEDVMLVDDVQFPNLFEMYKSEMHCQLLLVVVDNAVWEDDEFDDLEPLCVISPVIDPPQHPEPPPKQLEPPKQAEPPKQTDPIPDIFDNEEEYVGVNDEHMYIPIPPAQPSLNAQTYSYVPTNDTNENVADEGAIPISPEAEVTDADPEEIRVLHDPENPIIEKGALFPDITTFRKAVRHYAVKTGFEFASGIKTDPTRFIAKCKHPGCPWRIHASRLHDQKTIQVHTFPCKQLF